MASVVARPSEQLTLPFEVLARLPDVIREGREFYVREYDRAGELVSVALVGLFAALPWTDRLTQKCRHAVLHAGLLQVAAAVIIMLVLEAGVDSARAPRCHLAQARENSA